MKTLCSWLLAAALLTTACGLQGENHSAPNVLVIVIDTLRQVDLPLDGNSPENAPFLDAFSRKGVVFENAFSASSWTAPATASIFTSLYPNEHGVTQGLMATQRANRTGVDLELNRLPASIESLPVFMKSQGYTTFGVTANINIDEPLGFTRGFDYFKLIKDSGGADLVHEHLMGWSEKIHSAEQAFIYLHLMDPHQPYERHAEWMDKDAPLPKDLVADHAAYESEIRKVDEYLKRTIAELDLGDDTIILLTADHGEEFREHGRTGHPMTLYSELTRVPLFMKIGSDGPRGRSSANVSNIDILPTLRELLGCPPVPEEQGVSLLNIIEETERGNRQLFAMRRNRKGKEMRRIRSVISGSYKAIQSLHTDSSQLFNIDKDPGEKDDLASKEPKRLKAMLDLMGGQERLAVANGASESGTQHISAEDLEQLKKIGYTGD